MTTNEIRDRFLEFFKSHGHDLQQSAPIVNKDDPSLMFVNAGMNQFKDVFLGNEKPKHPRVTNSQKCLRVSGKHNDLEEVGVDTYHHTLFEMLGNWSFGDYFQTEAIDMAWKFLTQELKIAPENLYATYFEGHQGDGLEADTEAKNLWLKYLPEERILKGNKKDNFWEMGDVGPCGPCSEIHIDVRPQADREKVSGASLVNQDHPQVIEIWNLVFIAYNRFADGSLKPLPAKHVDTGMGLERLAMVLQGKMATYDIDLFAKFIAYLEEVSGKRYGHTDTKPDVAFRVIADHIRAIAFAIADGQLPSNTGAGYVIRRILRRAVRFGYSFLDFKEPFLYAMVPTLVHEMGGYFDELKKQEQFIIKVIREEELAFYKTLSAGIQKLQQYMEEFAANKDLPGEKAFELYDTFGFPFDLTQLILRENAWKTSEAGFNKAMDAQKNRSKKAAAQDVADWVELKAGEQTEFVGYDALTCETQVLRYRKVSQKGKDFYHLVLAKTPFYPEGGGQVGDSGVLQLGTEKIEVLTTKKENNLILHICEQLPQDLSLECTALVDAEKRDATKKNHTVTHLMHLALREVLGKHVEQRGSLVEPDYMRFDFSHFEKLKPEEAAAVENRVNAMIRENIALEEFRAIPKAQAEEMGAMALFGEKYGDTVRAIRFGPSVELCGGTHVKATGEIALAKIVSEGSVAAGVRRIEVKTGKAALNWYNDQLAELNAVKGLFKNSKDITKEVATVLEKNKKLEQRIKAQEEKEKQAFKDNLLRAKKPLANGLEFVSYAGAMDGGSAKDVAIQCKNQENLVAVLAVSDKDKAMVHIALGKNAIDKGLDAKALIKETAPLIKGGGGGQAAMASAGGKDTSNLSAVISKIEDLVSQ